MQQNDDGRPARHRSAELLAALVVGILLITWRAVIDGKGEALALSSVMVAVALVGWTWLGMRPLGRMIRSGRARQGPHAARYAPLLFAVVLLSAQAAWFAAREAASREAVFGDAKSWFVLFIAAVAGFPLAMWAGVRWGAAVARALGGTDDAAS